MKENKSSSMRFRAWQIGQYIRQFSTKLCSVLHQTSWIFISVVLLILYGILVLWRHRIFSCGDILLLVETFFAPISRENSRCKIFPIRGSQVRCLPNLFYIGASKTGTTSLVESLQNIPNIIFTQRYLTVPYDKHQEIHRFDRPRYSSTFLSWELIHEWASSPLVSSDRNTTIVHYTPHYLYAPSVPFDLARFYPASSQSQIKFLVTLREPCDRAVSSYWFKHSHLFQDNDQGDATHMIISFAKEISGRSQYELCILQYHRNKGRYHLSFEIPEITASNASFIRDTYLSFLSHMIDIAQQLLQFGYPPVHYFANQPIPSNVRVSGLHLLQEDHEQALQQCFGPKSYRSAKLGLRHVDKSIYIDQFARWLLHFPFDHFIVIALEDLAENAEESFKKIFAQLSTNKNSINSDLNKGFDNFSKNGPIEKKLVKPNKLYQALPDKEREVLEYFFLPYQTVLKKLFEKYRKS